MSKKQNLKNLHTNLCQAAKEAFKYAQNGDEYAYNNAAAKFSELDKKFDYELGAKKDLFEQNLENMLAPFQCDDNHFDTFVEHEAFHAMNRCIGITESAGLELIDQMF